MQNLPRCLLRCLGWWLIQAPRYLHIIIKRLTGFVNNEFSFTLNIRLIFTPLYGDFTLVGRFIGFFTRILFIVVGSFFVIVLLASSLIIPILWYVLPFELYMYIGWWALPIIVLTCVLVLLKQKNTPLVKLKNIIPGKERDAFRPKVVEFLKKPGSICLRELINSTSIQWLLQKSELQDPEFREKFITLTNLNPEIVERSALELAKTQNTRYVELEHLFLAITSSYPNIDTLLSTYATNLESLKKTVYWIVTARENLSALYFWQEEYVMPPLPGFGHGLTGKITPNLDAVSSDYTALAKKGRIGKIIGREQEIKKIADFLGSPNINVLLIGEPGCGKTSIIRGIAYKIVLGTEYKTLQNKRLISMDMGSLIAGAKTKGEMADKLKRAMEDITSSGDIILFIDEIHSLVGSAQEESGFSTVFSILEPYLSSNKVQFIGATNIENYRKYIEPMGSFSRLFEIVEIPESNAEDTLQILTFKSGEYENKYKIVISMPALLKIIALSGKLIHDRVLPDKAIDILNRVCTSSTNHDKFVTAKDVELEISEMTHIPVSSVTDDETEKLVNLENELKKRVIGQDQAIGKIAKAVRRARMGIRDEGKPIASFLFVGTTGVGKTETAKSLSAAYFGDKDSMIRLDMSEYQQADSINKLIGTSDGSTKGILTELVRSKPFCVILLDEIEKAHHQILLVFLQVLDDGRLTDSTGRTVYFTNTIIIATSNVGTRSIQSITERGGLFQEIEEATLKEVRNHFAPEFLNRFTGIIVYKPLSSEDVQKITWILLGKVRRYAEEKNIRVNFSDELMKALIKRGYSPEWGARPMARVIEDSVETYIADKMLAKEISAGSEITLGPELFSYE